MNSKKIMKIGCPYVTIKDGQFMLSADVSGPVSGTCYFSLPEAYREYVDPERSDCFLAGLLYVAMVNNCDLEIEGTVSELLLFNIRNYAIALLHGWDPVMNIIDVRAAETIVSKYPEAVHNGTGFSGGIDSFYTIYKRAVSDETPTPFKVDTLFFFNVGSHGMGNTDERLKWLEDKFKARYDKLKGFADELGLPYIPVNSNVHSFYSAGHLQTDTFVSMAAALFTSRKLAHYYLASAGYTPYNIIRWPDTFDSEIAIFNGEILHFFATESFIPFHDSVEASRIEKTICIAQYEPATRYLNVCGNQNIVDTHCLVCNKCKRTLAILDLTGNIEQFSRIFDLARFDAKQLKRDYAEIIIGENKDPYFKDIIEWAHENNIDIRSKTTFATIMYMRFTKTRIYRFLRKILKRDSKKRM